MTVLLVEDDQDLRALITRALRRRGIVVLEASRGAEGEALFDAHSPMVVVVDGLLPDEPGVALIERLRSRDRRARIVFISAFLRDLETFHRLSSELDVSRVFYKPLDPDDLASSVAALLAERTGTPSIPPPHDPSGVADQLEELRAQFGERLPQRLAELEAAIAEARADLSRAPDARGLAHKLRGTAGSYGFPLVGEAAGGIEDLLAAITKDAPLPAFFWDEVGGLVRDARIAMAHAPEPSEASPSGPYTQGNALLVVDDDPDFLHVVRSVGRKLALHVVTAEDPEEALQRARSQPLAGAILDVHLGDQDSFTLARQLRETRGNEEIPIAFASVDRGIDTLVAAIEAGGTRFFEKPISEESFGQLATQLVGLADALQGRVLIVDDDGELAELYARALRRAGYAVDTLPNADLLIEKLDQFRPDVLLLDVDMPRVSGMDVCRALRLSSRWELMPILIVTARTDTQTRLRAYRAGAADVIAKPLLEEELLARVGVQIQRLRLLRERADKDTLSGLLVRRAFLEALQRAVARAVRDEKPIALLLLDIDHFKKVNDEHGHLVGDRVIAGLGDLLRKRFRVEDLRCRWGGEEFLLAFPGQDAAFAETAGVRLLEEFSGIEFESDHGETFHVSFTAGVASYPNDASTIAGVIRSADERLYAGKRAGRHQVRGVGSSSFPPTSPIEGENP